MAFGVAGAGKRLEMFLYPPLYCPTTTGCYAPGKWRLRIRLRAVSVDTLPNRRSWLCSVTKRGEDGLNAQVHVGELLSRACSVFAGIIWLIVAGSGRRGWRSSAVRWRDVGLLYRYLHATALWIVIEGVCDFADERRDVRSERRGRWLAGTLRCLYFAACKTP